MEVTTKYTVHVRSWRTGLLFVLATLGQGVALHAQDAGNANDNTPAAAQAGSLPTGAGVSTPAAAQGGSSPIGSGVNTPETDQPDSTADSLRARVEATKKQRATNRSFNRVTTSRQEVVSTLTRTSRPGGTSTAGGTGMISRNDMLRPYSAQARLAQSARANSEVPLSSTQQPRPESQPVMVRSTPHDYYPSLRSGRYPNANTAQITRRNGITGGGGGGGGHICVPSRGSAMAGAPRGR